MENYSSSDSIFKVSVDHNTMEQLKTATTWARIVAIVGFISAGLTLLGSFVSPGASAAEQAVMVGSIFGSLIVAVIAVIINLFLYKFANYTATSLSTMNQEQFNSGINNLRSYFKIVGILVIIGLALAALFLMFFGLGSLASGS